MLFFIKWKKIYLLCIVLLLIGVFYGGGIWAKDEVCATETEDINKIDVQYYYLGDNTEQGKSMMDLLIMEKASGINDEGENYTSNQRRALIMHFCDVILRTNDDENIRRGCFDNGNFRYDPRQSLFVYALCVNMDDKGGDKEIAGTTFPKRNFREKVFQNVSYKGADKPFNLVKYIDEDIDKDLNVIRGLSPQKHLDSGIAYDTCNPKTSMQGCNMTRFLPHIFNTVMNAYSNMKLASIYGYKYILPDQDVEAQSLQRKQAIEDFSHAYFSSPKSDNRKDKNNECNAQGVFYLSNESLKSDNAAYCLHKKVYKILDETIKSLQELLKKVEYVKAKDILATSCKNSKYNLMSCAFSSTGRRFADNDRIAFQNLYTNELMWYTLFATYYIGQITHTSIQNPLQVSNYSATILKNQDEAEQLAKEVVFAREAMYQTMRRLRNLYTTFPLHIALMAYLEDLEKYRTVLSKTYTPFHQLSSLRPNAQSCQK